VPYIGGYEIGDPRGESVEGERKRIAVENPACHSTIGAIIRQLRSAASAIGEGCCNVENRKPRFVSFERLFRFGF
jgi:hypothetical protein